MSSIASTAQLEPSSPCAPYKMLLGLSVLTLGTICFHAFNIYQSSESTFSSPLLPVSRDDGPDGVAKQPPWAEAITSRLEHIEASIQKLTMHIRTLETPSSKPIQPRAPPPDMSREGAMIMLNIIIPVLCIAVKMVGLSLLETYLPGDQWLRAASFGFLGMNIAILGGLWCFETLLWFRLLLLAMVGMDVGVVVSALGGT